MDKRARRAPGRVAARAARRSASAGARARIGPRRRCSDGERTPGKVAIFSTCYVNYNEPGIGHDLLEAARAQRDPVRDRREGSVLRHAQARAGRPRGGGEAQGRRTSRCWRSYARDGYAILTRGAVVHADVQAGAAADVSGRRRRAGGAGRDVRSVRVPGRAPARTAC